MTTTEDELDVVTRSDVRAADKEAEDAERLTAALLERIESGSEDVSLDEVEAQEKVSRFARLRATGLRARAERHRIAMRVKSMKELCEEVLTEAPKSGDGLVAALKVVEDAAREFVRLAQEHDTRITAWRERADSFRVDWGTTEHGITNFGTVRVGGVPLELVSAPSKLAGILAANDNGGIIIRPEDDARLVATYRFLDGIGEVN